VNKQRYKTIFELSLPIVGGMASQNVMNLVDTALVGSLGPNALAAVGMGSVATFMAQAFIMGLSAGVQAMAARRFGEGAEDRMAEPLNGGLLLALAVGVPTSVVLWLLTPSFYPYLNADPAVIEQGVPYLRARLCGVAAVGMNFSFRGYFNGVNLPKLYLRSLLSMHSINIVLCIGLIYGRFGLPRLGSLGAGVATTIATWCGTAIYMALALRHARTAGFLRALPDGATLGAMWQLSMPSGVRQLFFSAGFTALFWIVGRVSTTALAAANVMINLMLVAILPAMGLGMAAASLVGQALGREDRADAMRWGWDVTRVALLVLGALGLPMLLAPDALLSVFTSDPRCIDEGRWPLRLVGATIAVDGIGLVLQNAMLGAGDSRRVMVVAIVLQWALFLPAAYLVGPLLGFGLVGIWIAQIGHRGLQAAAFALLWRGGKWADVKL
jgi:putative MATE family efflux protein